MSQQFWKTLPLALRLPAAARQRPRRVDDQRTRPVGAIVIVRRRRGSAADFHALQIPAALDEAEAWVFEVERPALVLGSSQRGQVTVADPAVEVVRRNSGGGAVLLVPGRCLWIDVLLARDDPRWSDDVGKSSYWLGEVWASALPGSEVYRGRLQQTTWGRLVCFGALGPGEVTIAGRKVVGPTSTTSPQVPGFRSATSRRPSWRRSWPDRAARAMSGPAPIRPDRFGRR